MSGIGQRTVPTFDKNIPTNYVAGIGRGAMGFTTRSDIGPARAPTEPLFGQAPVGYVAGQGRGMGELARANGEFGAKASEEVDIEKVDYSEGNYDEFSGYSENLFATGAYEEDDKEADLIYSKVDEEMENRRKRSREKAMLDSAHGERGGGRARIADQFVDLKRELAKVSFSEWDSIPEVGEYSHRPKESKFRDTYMPVPDSIIMSGVKNAQSTVDMSTGVTSNVLSNLIAGDRSTLMSSKLDSISDSISGQTVVDPKGYMTSLNSLKIASSAEVGDIKKARLLLQSVTSTNPKHGPGWIAAARVEELAGKIRQARNIILQGCSECPQSEDVWLEAARLHPNDVAKAILANGVKNLPTSVNLWLKASELETSENKKKQILRKSLEFVPTSVALWKAAIELENANDAKVLLYRAVECVPQSVDMWLALAKLETHENARKVLNQAREALPTERATWITAAKLEEAHGNFKLVSKIISKMISSLTQYNVVIKRADWIAEAVEAERTSFPVTCRAIIQETIAIDVEPEDRKATWMNDASMCLTDFNPPAVNTARAILNFALEIFPTKSSLWQQLILLEKDYGDKEIQQGEEKKPQSHHLPANPNLQEILQKAVLNCTKSEILWLIAAKELWMRGSLTAAKTALASALTHLPDSELIYLASAKLEVFSYNPLKALEILKQARDFFTIKNKEKQNLNSPQGEKIWIQSAVISRYYHHLLNYSSLHEEMKEKNYEELQKKIKELKKTSSYLDDALKFCDEGIKIFPNSIKFYLIAGQIKENYLNDLLGAKNYYQQGLRACPTSVPLWKSLIYLDLSSKGGILKARSTGELARIKAPKNEHIYQICIQLEKQAGSPKLAATLLAQGLKELPKSPILWAEKLESATRVEQRGFIYHCKAACGPTLPPILSYTLAHLHYKQRNYLRAARRLERSIQRDPKFGDSWVLYFACLYSHIFSYFLLNTSEEEKVIKETETETTTPQEGEEEDKEEEEGEDVSQIDHIGQYNKQFDLEELSLQEPLYNLLKRVTEASPTHGELWISISKQVPNIVKTPAEILLKAFHKLTNLQPTLYKLPLPLPPTYIEKDTENK